MVDLFIIIFIAIGAYSGYKRGFILSIAGIIALLAGLYGAFKLLNWSISLISGFFTEINYLVPLIAFLVVFVVIIILVNILGKTIKKAIDFTPLGVLDNFAGALLNLFTTAFMISLILWILEQVHIHLPDKFTDSSYLYPVVQGFAPLVGGYLSSLFPFLEKIITEIRDYLILP